MFLINPGSYTACFLLTFAVSFLTTLTNFKCMSFICCKNAFVIFLPPSEIFFSVISSLPATDFPFLSSQHLLPRSYSELKLTFEFPLAAYAVSNILVPVSTDTYYFFGYTSGIQTFVLLKIPKGISPSLHYRTWKWFYW